MSSARPDPTKELQDYFLRTEIYYNAAAYTIKILDIYSNPAKATGELTFLTRIQPRDNDEVVSGNPQIIYKKIPA